MQRRARGGRVPERGPYEGGGARPRREGGLRSPSSPSCSDSSSRCTSPLPEPREPAVCARSKRRGGRPSPSRCLSLLGVPHTPGLSRDTCSWRPLSPRLPLAFLSSRCAASTWPGGPVPPRHRQTRKPFQAKPRARPSSRFLRPRSPRLCPPRSAGAPTACGAPRTSGSVRLGVTACVRFVLSWRPASGRDIPGAPPPHSSQQPTANPEGPALPKSSPRPRCWKFPN